MISIFQTLGFSTYEMYGLLDVLDLPCFASSNQHDNRHLCFCIKRGIRKWGSLCDIIRVWTDKCYHHHLHHLELITIIAELPPRSYLILITCANDVTLRLECFGRFRPVGGWVAPIPEPPVEQTPLYHNHLSHNISTKYQTIFGVFGVLKNI